MCRGNQAGPAAATSAPGSTRALVGAARATMRRVEIRHPLVRFDARHDDFVVWVRWVSLEQPPSPEKPANQGVRVELQLNKNAVLGPTVLWRRDLDRAPVYLRCNRDRVVEVLRAAAVRGTVDIQLIIHGSIANAPYAALFHTTDYDGEAIETRPIEATPMLQVQPSTPADRWHVAAQANVRVAIELVGSSHRLKVVR